MNKRRDALFIIGVAGLLFFLGQLLFAPKAYLTSRIGKAFQAPATFIRSLSTRGGIMRELTALSLENQSLRAQLLREETEPALVREGSRRYLKTPVYSSYPFNSAHKLLAALITGAEVEVRAPVYAAPGVFLGEVSEITDRKAAVRTIFDSGWELPVRIGENKVDALLIGGQEPRLTLISKRKAVLAGEEVVLASRDFPYGLLLGMVSDLKPSDDTLFLEAKLTPPYLISDLTEIYLGVL